jgi:hypothetical protein
MSLMKQMLGNSYLFGANAPFIEELYESYLANPASVADVWRDYFDKLQNMPGAGRDVAHAPVIASFAQRAKLGTLRAAPAGAGADKKQVAVLQLINAYRFLGNRWASSIRSSAPSGLPSRSWSRRTTASPRPISVRASPPAVSPACPSRPPCARSSRRCARPTAAPSAPSTCT